MNHWLPLILLCTYKSILYLVHISTVTDGYDVGGVTTALPQDAADPATASASLQNPQTGNRDIDWLKMNNDFHLKHRKISFTTLILECDYAFIHFMYILCTCNFSIHPGDLYPYSRKAFFLIVDSDNSSVFLGMPNLFNQPVITFASPVDLPAYLQGTLSAMSRKELGPWIGQIHSPYYKFAYTVFIFPVVSAQPKRGSLFSLFLHSPLTAFCYICNINEIPIALWDKCQAHVDKFMCDAGRLLVRCPKTGKASFCIAN